MRSNRTKTKTIKAGMTSPALPFDITLSPLLAAILTGFTVSVVSPNRDIGTIALAGSTGLLGMVISEKLKPTDAELSDQLQRQTHLRTAAEAMANEEREKAARVRSEFNDATKLVSELRADIDRVVAQNISHKESIRGFESGQQYKAYEEQIEKLNSATTEKIALLENELVDAQNALAKNIAKRKSVLTTVNDKNIAAQSTLKARIAELETELAETQAVKESNLKEAEGILTEVDATALDSIDSGNRQLEDLQLRLNRAIDDAEKLRKANAECQSKLDAPARFEGAGIDSQTGNSVIDFLRRRGLTLSALTFDHELDRDLQLFFRPGKDVTLDALNKLMPEMQIELRLHDVPSVDFKNGCFEIRLAVNQRPAKNKTVPNVPLTRLEKTLDTAIHVRIVGGSGSGKSVLLNNLMHYLEASMKGANVTLLDPKAVDDWGKFTPRYWGEECVEGIVDLANGLKWRVADTVKHRKAGKPAPGYDPELFVLDEAQHNYLMAQNADDSYIKERGETAPNFAKKAKGALAGLLSLGRAYDAIGLFVTQLPQVSKVGLNDGSFDPCVNIFLGSQIDNAIDSFLPGSGFIDTKCKALEKELALRRKLGQQWVTLVADLPKTEAYLMECPAPGYYHSLYSGISGTSPNPGNVGEKRESPATTVMEDGEGLGDGKELVSDSQAIPATPTADKTLSAHCPGCKHKSAKLYESKPAANGKYRFSCENNACKKKTFRAMPLA